MAGSIEKTNTRCVLIVEDNDDGCNSLKLMLSLHGCEVETARDGVEGVRKGMALRPTAAVIDIGLPGMNGYEVACQLRKLYKANIMLIAYTGWNTPADREHAKEAGFDLLVAKPAEPKELVRLLILGTNLPGRTPALPARKSARTSRAD
jgi:CheY-like chemotaxis protein